MSSKRRIRRQSCIGKKRHLDVGTAFAHARRLGWPWQPYKCKFCKGYHVGRKTKKIIQLIVEKH